MDDSRVGSLDKQTHLRHLEVFFNALATNGLAINLEKCVFAVPSLEILGHTISAAGAAPTVGHAAEIEFCPPSTCHQTTAAFSQHSEFLLSFSAQLRTRVVPFD
jgi:hypothetical protein